MTSLTVQIDSVKIINDSDNAFAYHIGSIGEDIGYQKYIAGYFSFQPTMSKLYSADVQVFSGHSVFSGTISGRGIAADLHVEPTELAFSAVLVANSKVDSVLFENTSNAEIQISEIQFLDTLNNPFSYSGTATVAIPANSSVYLKFAFMPLAEETYYKAISVTATANNLPIILQLSGVGISAEIFVDDKLEFEPKICQIGEMLDSLLIQNKSNIDIQITSINRKGTQKDYFEVKMATPIPIQANTDFYLPVYFSGEAIGDYAATFELMTDIGTKHEVVLSARRDNYELELSESPVRFATGINQTDAKTITITNIGSLAYQLDFPAEYDYFTVGETSILLGPTPSI